MEQQIFINDKQLMENTKNNRYKKTKKYVRRFVKPEEAHQNDLRPIFLGEELIETMPENTKGTLNSIDKGAIFFIEYVVNASQQRGFLSMSFDLDYRNFYSSTSISELLTSLIFRYSYMCYVLRRCFMLTHEYHHTEINGGINNKIKKFNEIFFDILYHYSLYKFVKTEPMPEEYENLYVINKVDELGRVIFDECSSYEDFIIYMRKAYTIQDKTFSLSANISEFHKLYDEVMLIRDYVVKKYPNLVNIFKPDEERYDMRLPSDWQYFIDF